MPIPTFPDRPLPALAMPDAPLQGRQFEVYTSGGIICITGGFYYDPTRGHLIAVPGVWTGQKHQVDGWAVALVFPNTPPAQPDVVLTYIPGFPDGLAENYMGAYILILARVIGRSILPILSGGALVFSPP